MYITSATQPEVWVSGLSQSVQLIKTGYSKMQIKSIPVWKIGFPDSIQNAALIALKIAQEPGIYGGTALLEPIRFDGAQGKIQVGNLANHESLRTYSGGMWYRKQLNITSQQAASKEITLDLGDLVSSAEVRLNGKAIGTKLSPPWKFDLSRKLQVGSNTLEVLITIPWVITI